MKELEGTSPPDISKLRKSDPNLFSSCKDAFANHLGDCIGLQGYQLQYVVRDDTPPTTFAMTEQKRNQPGG
eukprot:4211661-Ditylum_brightwellii.AAC.1